MTVLEISAYYSVFGGVSYPRQYYNIYDIMQAFSIMDKLRVGPLSFVVLFSEVTKLMHHYCRDNLSFVQRLSLFLEGQILEIVYAVVLLPRRYQKALQKKKKNTP